MMYDARMATPEQDLQIATLRSRIADLQAVEAALAGWTKANADELTASRAALDVLTADPVTPTPEPEPDFPAESYGPVGEWPVELEWARAGVSVRVTHVAPRWDAIAKAESAFRSGPTIIAVLPGKLDGFGSGSTDKPVLSGIRRPENAPLLVMAAGGFGSVTVSKSWRLDKLKGVGFAHFDMWPYGYVATNCEDLTFARSTVKPANISTTILSSGITMHELVRLEPVNEDADAWAVRNSDKSPNAVTEDIILRGCLGLGAYKAAGSAAHCDTFQVSGAGKFRRFTFDRTLIVASSNHGLIFTTSTDDVLIRDSAIIAGAPRLARFPDRADRYKSGGGIAINGKPTNIRAERSIATGKVVPDVPGLVAAGTFTEKWWETHAPTLDRDDLARLWARNSPLG